MTIKTFLTQLCEHCGMAKEEVNYQEKQLEQSREITLSIPDEDSGLFIGFHGETLESIQRILRIIFQKDQEDRIIFNINNYRQQRKKKLQELTAAAVEQVLAGESAYIFRSYLPAYERFIIHTALAEMPDAADLESVSVGFGRDRRLQIQRKKS